MEIWTIGHSTRQFDTFVQILKKHGIETVIDVREFPKSIRMPWFKKGYMEIMLPKYYVNYIWLGSALGGFKKDGFEKHMTSSEFLLAMQQVTDTALSTKTAIMCSESVFSRCHRKHIADHLAEKGWTINHIYDERRVERHILLEHQFAR